jgi:hypothetical protein
MAAGEDWECAMCTFRNAADSAFCEMCEYSRPEPGGAESVLCDICHVDCSGALSFPRPSFHAA